MTPFLRASCVGLGLLAVACGDSSGPADVAPGTMHVQITGAVQYESDWEAVGQFEDELAAVLPDRSYLFAHNPSAPEFNLNVFYHYGQLGVGKFASDVVIDLGGRIFVAIPKGTIVGTAANYPARPGLIPGLLRGTMTFKAVEYVVNPPVDTITVIATFAAHWYHYLNSHVTASLSGNGPALGNSSPLSAAQSAEDGRGGRVVWWDADYDPYGGKSMFESRHEIRIMAPAVGNFVLARVTPSVARSPGLWPDRFTALYFRDDARVALSTGGTLTITRLVLPTDVYYGEIHGTLTSRLALWANDGAPSADTMLADMTFAVPLFPLAGPPDSHRWPDRTVMGYWRTSADPRPEE